jgi:negative regulator of sigma E activity
MRSKSRILILCFMAIGGCLIQTGRAEEKNESSQIALLKEADLHRGGGIEGLAWELSVREFKAGQEKSRIDFSVDGATRENRVMAKITYLTPKKYEGQKMLVRDHNLWFAKPGFRRAVPISGRQRLTGAAANADVASANYANDYDIDSVSTDSINGIPCTLLVLKAKNSLVAYPKIKYWVDDTKRIGIKAEFFGVSGKLIKRAAFEYGGKLLYKKREIAFVSRIRIKEELNEDNETTLELSHIVAQDQPLAKFEPASLIE